MAIPANAAGAAQVRLQAPWLGDVLETIAEFGAASMGLVAWELCLPVEELAAAWRHAVSEGLIEEAGRCRQTAEVLYRLVPLEAVHPAARRDRSGS